MTSEPPPLEALSGYNLIEKVADGGMGSIYKACHQETKQIVAIKVLSPEIAHNSKVLKRFEQEFRLTRRLQHPNIVRVLEYSGTGPNPHIVMEFIEGESLGKMIEREGRIAEAAAVQIIVQACKGLEQAHREGLLHRDIKPDNIMVLPDGTVKVIDLGLAKAEEGSPDLTRAGSGLGTPNFMSPEQFRNAKSVDARSDIYSLAATLYQAVTGEIPFGVSDPIQIFSRKIRNDLPSPRSIVPDLSEQTDRAIRHALSVERSQRPASCREFMEELTGERKPPPEEMPVAAAAPSPNPESSPPPAKQEPEPPIAAPAGPEEPSQSWQMLVLILMAVIGMLLVVLATLSNGETTLGP